MKMNNENECVSNSENL